MTHFRPSMIATMVASALTAGTIGAVNATPVNTQSLKPISHTNLSELPSFGNTKQKALAKQATASGMPSQYDAKLAKATFLWAGLNQTKPALDMIAFDQRNEYAANYYLNALTGISADKNASVKAVLRNMHDTERGAIVAKYKQEVNGIEVFNREYNVMMDREHSLVAGSGYFANAKGIMRLAPQAQALAFGKADSAVVAAFAAKGGDSKKIQLSNIDSTSDYAKFAVNNAGDLLLLGQPRAKKVFFEHKGKLVPAYYVEIETAKPDSTESDMFAYVISVKDQSVLFKMDLTAHANDFNYRIYADETAPNHPWDGPHGDVIPAASADQVDATEYLAAPMVTLSSAPFSHMDPWLAADATTTEGNNARAYVDAVAPDGLTDGDYVAETTSTATFDYSYDTSKAEYSTHNRKASVVNLFYMNNYLHDIFYDHGFDEASGNAQNDNYGRGGEEGDALRVEAQDNSGFNNANMSTPADGNSPRMQMYLWTKEESDVVYASASSSSHADAGLFTNIQRPGIGFGPGNFSVEGQVVEMVDGSGDTTDGCEAAVNGHELEGKIALINRGACNFTQKVINAQNAGAIGALVANHSGGNQPSSMGGSDPAVAIGSLGVTQNDGIKLRELLAGETPVMISYSGTAAPLRGSSWDNGVVAHEWGHYITNRLIGNASGLYNNQGRSMGEGWGDFHALLLLSSAADAAKPGNDKFQAGYADGSYVSSFYYGIRQYPYSTDLDVNPSTFANITDNPEVHGSGAVWGAHMWDAFVGMINKHGYDMAKTRMMDYLVASYKMTPIGPTMTEARDALLATAYATDPEDYQTILGAFARRGMGLGAVSPDRDSAEHEGVEESTSVTLTSLAVTSHDLNVNYAGTTSGFCSNDNILDKGETGTISIAVANRGSESIAATTAMIEVTSGQDVTFANGGIVNLADLGPTMSGTSNSIEFTLNEAATADKLEFKVSFPDLADDVASDYKLATTVNMDFALRSPVNLSDKDNMESVASAVNFKERVLAGGDQAVGTQYFDGSMAGDILTYLGYDVGSRYMVLNNNGFYSDVVFETQPMQIGYNGAFKVSWWHYFEFESQYDGGVVEVSINGGNWVDVTEVGGTFMGDGYLAELVDHSGQPLPNRGTFTDANAGIEGVDFGVALNGSQVAFRFRAVADTNSAAFGWIIDDVKFQGIESGVFNDVVAGDSVACDNRLPIITEVSADAAYNEGTTVNLSVTATDPNGGALTYAWTQISGTEVTLTGGDSATPSFTAPEVDADGGVLTFSVTVSDGTDSVTSSIITVTVNDVLPVIAEVSADAAYNEGATVDLTVMASDPNGGALTYAWAQLSGTEVTLTGADSAAASFTAPEVDTDGGVLTFAVTVSDGTDSVTSSTVTVTVNDVPAPPAPPAPPVIHRVNGGGSTGLIALLLMPLAFIRRRKSAK
jgi:hypothetical protein